MVVAIKDEKANEFIGDLMLVRNEFEASRVMASFDSRFGKHGDFQIYKLAEFNPSSGVFSEPPKLLAKFIDEDDEEVTNEIKEVATQVNE